MTARVSKATPRNIFSFRKTYENIQRKIRDRLANPVFSKNDPPTANESQGTRQFKILKAGQYFLSIPRHMRRLWLAPDENIAYLTKNPAREKFLTHEN
jgi:hypothetical protein